MTAYNWFVVKKVDVGLNVPLNELQDKDFTKEVVTTNCFGTARSCLDGSKQPMILCGIAENGKVSGSLESNVLKLQPVLVVKAPSKPVQRINRNIRRSYDMATLKP